MRWIALLAVLVVAGCGAGDGRGAETRSNVEGLTVKDSDLHVTTTDGEDTFTIVKSPPNPPPGQDGDPVP